MMRTIYLLLLFTLSTSALSHDKESVAKLDYQIYSKFSYLKLYDQNIDKKLNSIITLVNKFEDSPQAKKRINCLKEKLINTLKKSVKSFSNIRKFIFIEMESGNSYFNHNFEALKDWCDHKIKLRVKQIVVMSRSLDNYRSKYSCEKETEREKTFSEMQQAIFKLSIKVERLKKEVEHKNSKYSIFEVANEMTVTVQKIELLKNSLNELGKDKTIRRKVDGKNSIALYSRINKRLLMIESVSKNFFNELNLCLTLLQKRKSITTN